MFGQVWISAYPKASPDSSIVTGHGDPKRTDLEALGAFLEFLFG